VAQLPVFYARSRSIEEHVGYIIQQKNKGRSDPEIRMLAVKITSSSYVWQQDPRTGRRVAMIKAWNKLFYAPRDRDICAPRDDGCEIVKMWDFVVQNVRYVYDPNYVDTFATTKYTLEMGGGDCDDFTIVFANLLEAVGFHMRARVISTPEEPDNWVHIYPVVGVSKDDPSSWMPLDATVSGYKPGDEWPKIAKQLDFEM
jgi:Transglutaminase-like superfamily